MQTEMRRREEARDPEQRIEVRIGINVGDAIATGDHIHRGGRGKIARRFGVALIPVGLILNGCVADPTPECAQASKDFEEALPPTSDVHLASVDVLPAIVAGVALAVVERLPDDGQRQRCYDEIMRARFYSYPPYATVR
jgi:hypothetical protein